MHFVRFTHQQALSPKIAAFSGLPSLFHLLPHMVITLFGFSCRNNNKMKSAIKDNLMAEEAYP